MTEPAKCEACHAGSDRGPLLRWWYAKWDPRRFPQRFTDINLHAYCVGGFLAWNAAQGIDIVLRPHPMMQADLSRPQPMTVESELRRELVIALDVAMGLHSGYPACCVEEYVADVRAGVATVGAHRFIQHGLDPNGLHPNCGYVPCSLHLQAWMNGKWIEVVRHDCAKVDSPTCQALSAAREVLLRERGNR